MREAERRSGARSGRYHAGAYPSNLTHPLFDPPRAEVLADRFGWTVDPADHGAAGRPVAIEVYPHPAMVVLFGLARVLPYKAKKGRDVGGAAAPVRAPARPPRGAGRAAAGVPTRAGPRSRRSCARPTRQVRPRARSRTRSTAIFCAHLAWLWAPPARRADGLRNAARTASSWRRPHRSRLDRHLDVCHDRAHERTRGLPDPSDAWAGPVRASTAPRATSSCSST